MADTEQEPVYAIIFGERIEHNGGPAPADALAAESEMLTVHLRGGVSKEGYTARHWCRDDYTGTKDWWQWEDENFLDIIAYQIGRKVDVTALIARAEAAEKQVIDWKVARAFDLANAESRAERAEAIAAELAEASRVFGDEKPLQYETEYAGRMYTRCVACDAALSEGKAHSGTA